MAPGALRNAPQAVFLTKTVLKLSMGCGRAWPALHCGRWAAQATGQATGQSRSWCGVVWCSGGGAAEQGHWHVQHYSAASAHLCHLVPWDGVAAAQAILGTRHPPWPHPKHMLALSNHGASPCRPHLCHLVPWDGVVAVRLQQLHHRRILGLVVPVGLNHHNLQQAGECRQAGRSAWRRETKDPWSCCARLSQPSQPAGGRRVPAGRQHVQEKGQRVVVGVPVGLNHHNLWGQGRAA